MASKPRTPMQVAPEFEKRIKDLQKKIMIKHGKNMSLRDLTEKVAKSTDFDQLERAILSVDRIDIKINLDRRKR